MHGRSKTRNVCLSVGVLAVLKTTRLGGNHRSVLGNGRCRAWKPQFVPHRDHALDEFFGELIVVAGVGGDPQALGPFWDRRVVNRLHVDAMLGEEQIACLLALLRVTDHENDNVSRVRCDRQTGSDEALLDGANAHLVRFPLALRLLEVSDRSQRCGANRRRKRGREDEARRVGPDGVDQRRVRCDITADTAKRFAQGSLDNIDTPHRSIAFCDATAARSVKSNSVYFIKIGQRAVALSKRADCLDRRHVAIHRIEALEYDQLRSVLIGRTQQLFEMDDVAVPEDQFFAAGLADTSDQRIVIETIGENQATGKQLRDRRDACFVCHIARREHERRLLAMEIGKLVLELHDRVMRASDVARPARTRAHRFRRVDHGRDDPRVLTHAEIVVGAPDYDVLGALGRMPKRAREAPRDTLEIGKFAIAALLAYPGECRLKEALIVHGSNRSTLPMTNRALPRYTTRSTAPMSQVCWPS